MTEAEKLQLLKLDLQLMTDAFDTLLTADLAAAEEYMEREGIVLTDSVGDTRLHVMYAAYLYRQRAIQDMEQGGSGMPRMLRYALNNRLFSQKVGD